MWRRGIARGTKALSEDERDPVRGFLDLDPIGNAVVWNRAFQLGEDRAIYVDDVPPKAVAALARPRWAQGATGLAVHATEPSAVTTLPGVIPPGYAFVHLTEEWLLPILEPRASEIQAKAAWLFALDREDFVDLQRHEVERIGPEWALMIAKFWEPEWTAEPYVRSRIEAGPAVGVYQDGDLVAWALTHFETEHVSMMGFLHVKEEHRGKGYAKSVSAALIKEILKRGKTPALHVYVDNVPSLELTPQLGFHRVKRQMWADAVFR